MLKKLAKRIEKELAQADDYIEQSYLVKHKSSETADLFMSLGAQEIEHAEKLLKEGRRLLDESTSDKMKYLDEEKETVVHEECKAIWEWETRLAMDKVLELKYKLSIYRSMR